MVATKEYSIVVSLF